MISWIVSPTAFSIFEAMFNQERFWISSKSFFKQNGECEAKLTCNQFAHKVDRIYLQNLPS